MHTFMYIWLDFSKLYFSGVDMKESHAKNTFGVKKRLQPSKVESYLEVNT